ncbi:MAG: exodeoxyribonuclease VII large subunit [Myxococcales bacterium]|nr:exodeoxyribonuclease VII large subunit [Myxococcales bacterium]MCB9582948.1 exodeoxyribonuclease VII large subunit [Polyangiaceae bacterium]
MSGTEDIITVAELDRRLKRAVESATGSEWVQGEIGSLKIPPSGHAYFTLKDEADDAVIDCVLYRFNAQRARRHLAEGARVQIFGRATVWAPRGRLQLVGERLRPAGRGALLEALQKLKERLAGEGLFDAARKRALPSDPRVVGVVTSKSGAAFHDIRTVAFRRGGVRLVLSPALVQGEAAADSLVRALDLLEGYPGLDAVIIGRGGGSFEDLMPFNDERVVRRVAACRVPVVSAVGHEVDTSLSDLAADVRAATPSQAAELVIADHGTRAEHVLQMERRLTRAALARLDRNRAGLERLDRRLGDPRLLIFERQQLMDELCSSLERHGLRAIGRERGRLEKLDRRLAGRHPRAVLARARADMARLEGRLSGTTRLRVGRAAGQLAAMAARLDGLSPLAVLGRGYAIALDQNGRALRSARETEPGNAIGIRLHRGRITATVTDVEDGE